MFILLQKMLLKKHGNTHTETEGTKSVLFNAASSFVHTHFLACGHNYSFSTLPSFKYFASNEELVAGENVLPGVARVAACEPFAAAGHPCPHLRAVKRVRFPYRVMTASRPHKILRAEQPAKPCLRRRRAASRPTDSTGFFRIL